jgi:hypothetical protein
MCSKIIRIDQFERRESQGEWLVAMCHKLLCSNGLRNTPEDD